MSFNETRLDVNGIDTAVFTAGTGDPVVFLHGGGSVTGFDALLPIAERNQLIVAHHPGFGASGGPACESVFDLARHHLDVLDALDVDTFALVGHSMGGWTAATMATFAGSRISRLVLGAPAGRVSENHPMVDLLTLPPEELLGWLSEDMSIFEAHIPNPPPPEFLADREREGASFAAIAADGCFDPGLDRWLHRLTMPTLLLWGEADRLIPFGQAEEWKALLPQATIKSFAGAGHLLFDERAEAVAAVADFVSG